MAWLSIECWRLTGLHTSRWNWWRVIYFGCLFLQRSRLCGSVGVSRFCSARLPDTPSCGSPIRTYVDSHYSMCVSNDADRSNLKDLFSLGVVDLDLSISPDVFGLLMYLSH